MVFATNSSDRLTISSTGAVGIGTTNPDALLHLQSAGAASAHINLETTHSGGIPIYNMKGAHSSQVRYQDENGNNQSRIDFHDAGRMDFVDAANGVTRMQIDSSGNFLVGTTTPIVSSHTIVKDGGVPLSLKRLTNASSQNSLLLGYGTGGNTANIQVRGNGDARNTTGVFTTISSDRRTKEDIADATGKLADLCKLSVKNFYYKDQPHEGKQIGFIADEMIDIFPSLVTEEDTREYDADGNVIKGYADQKGIKVGGIGFAILTKAIQEQQAIIEDLQTQINEVKNGN